MDFFSNSNKNKSIAIIGDFCLDFYYFTNEKNTEISLETNLPTYSIKNSKFELGGAANVAVNAKYIGIENIDIYGITGDDYFGLILRNLLKKEKINTDNLFTQYNNFNSNVYHKIYNDNQELPRYDSGNFNIPDRNIQDKIINKLEYNLEKYDLIIINEQVINSIHTDYFCNKLNILINKFNNKTWISDCRSKNNIYKSTIHKLNNHEGYSLVQQLTNNFENISETINDKFIIKYLYNYWKFPLVLTRGENGALIINDNNEINEINGLHIIQQIDSVGAGDAFLAGLAYGLINNYNLEGSANIGNFSAGVSCTKLFETGHPSQKEINDFANLSDYRYNPLLAKDVRKATYYKDSDIEIINPLVINSFSNYPQICIFDHDGTISTLRQGWEEIMLNTMIESIAGKKYDTLSNSQIENITNQSKQLIEKTTGVQTIIQMQELVKLVKLNHYVDENDILDAWGYKKIYNDRLLVEVYKRREKFKNHQINIDDVTLKGAVKTLNKLSTNDSMVYLASGTDEEDVINEATALGYNSYFNGGIHGSTGDISTDPKRKVIKDLIKDIKENNHIKVNQCVVFGDGPVEMREAKKHGLVAIGIVSDETRRWGKNIAKRERLILGGADILIPDFSYFEQLAKLLGWV